MKRDNPLKYCLKTTVGHPVAKKYQACHSTICEILKREGGNGRGFNADVVVDLDQVEKNLAKREGRSNRATVDFYMGLSRSGKDKHIALVELKLNVSNPYGLSKTDLEEKVRGSMSIELTGRNPAVLTPCPVVFKNGVIQQAKHILHNLSGNKPDVRFQAMTEEELRNTFWE